jgi:hypothetical protein
MNMGTNIRDSFSRIEVKIDKGGRPYSVILYDPRELDKELVLSNDVISVDSHTSHHEIPTTTVVFAALPVFTYDEQTQ